MGFPAQVGKIETKRDERVDRWVPNLGVNTVQNPREFPIVFLQIFVQPAAKFECLDFVGITRRNGHNTVRRGYAKRQRGEQSPVRQVRISPCRETELSHRGFRAVPIERQVVNGQQTPGISQERVVLIQGF